ncbi:COX4-domain-containing protein [Jaminaea rosea]|uniref:COX4-domain-containing protein n=1 Tax=Jaminaea rosea TaxID=1569628 RepID=A0A316UQ41_9BASI|nr:COX4-domain-containing protein [Jaminaea rosea]PWN25255.1 COX4-domain-containing protein [Jaminaea rosea]
MLTPALRNTSRNALRSAVHSTSVPSSSRRTLLTKAEKWSLSDAREAEAALEAPGSNANKVQLSQVVPNIEARWAHMSKVEQYAVYRQLEEVQRKDWKELSLDEKKAAYFVSFGPHGPRKPITPPGQGIRTLVGVSGLCLATFGVFYTMRQFAPPPPKTMTKEYQEQSNERAREDKINPITGISSEGYKGKGYVQE